MRFSRTSWLLVILALVVSASLVVRFIGSRQARSSGSVPDRSLASPLNQPGGSAVAADAYEVYSALYQDPQPEPLAFAADSQADIPQVNGSCIKPSTPDEQEMNDAFVAANQQSHRWERKFAIPANYLLLSRADASQAQTCIQSRGKGGADCAPYAQLRHVRFLGVPGFDHAHTHALVSVIKFCGGDCGSGGIFEVEKAGNTWRRSDATDFTRECSWVY